MISSDPGATRESLSPAAAAGLQLLPGLANLIAFVPLAYWFHRINLPPFLALAVAILIAEVPTSWYIIVRCTRRETGSGFRLTAAFPWRADIAWWFYAAVGVPLIIFGVAMTVIVAPAIAAEIRDAVAPDVPSWFLLEPDPEIFASLPRTLLITMWLATLLVFAGIGGFTQELYSRGFLLPRTQHWGAWAPAFNALLFGVFHLQAPWSWPGFAILALPWAYLVWRTRSIKIGLVGHIGMLLVQSLMMSLLVFGIVSPPQM